MEFVHYIKESYRELREEVTWVSFEEAQKSTIIVAIFTIIFALAVFAADKTFQTVLDKFFSFFN